jgi:hypothetical protein
MLLVGCGGGDGSPTTQPTSTQAQPATTTQPTSTTTTTTVVVFAGTEEDPVPSGAQAEVLGWALRVLSVRDGTQAVLDESSSNVPPAAGNLYLLVELEATRTGDTVADVYWDFTWSALGRSGVTYDEFDADCGVIPESIGDAGEVAVGVTVTGTVCWEVAESDVTGLLLVLEDLITLEGITQFFELAPAD